jgi:hypothetical protein
LVEGEGFEMNWPEPSLVAAISAMYFPRWYEGCGEKCILQPLLRETEVAGPILQNKKHQQNQRDFAP